jgi:hypothetical protein
MFIEDIETALKDHIQAEFTLENGEVDHLELASAIEDVTDSKQAKYRLLRSVVRHYLTLQGADDPTPKKEWIEEAYALANEKKPAKSLDDLTLAEYTSLLLHKSRWPTYGKNFALDSKAMQKLLDEVCDTRNMLAHFRGEISVKQREQLRFCDNWLTQHPPAIPVGLAVEDAVHMHTSTMVEIRESPAPYVVTRPVDQIVTPTDEELTPRDSRYAPLALWLQSQPISQDRVTLSFEQIEAIINGELPPSARQHRSWWANDSVGHVQSQQWLDVGWRASYINMTEGRITFARIQEREKEYIRFFSALLSDLHTARQYPSKAPSPDGHNWLNVLWLSEDRQLIPFAYSFARGKRFRVELYIDIGDQAKNKRIFDELQNQKGALETIVGEALSWERLNEKRASRIAIYHEGSITDKPEQLAQLRTWAANALIRLYEALAQPASEALKAVQ